MAKDAGIEIRRIVGLPSRRELPDESRAYPIDLVVGQAGESSTATFSLDVSTPDAFEEGGTPRVLSDRARLVVRELDWDRVRRYLVALVRACGAPTLHAVMPLLERYFVDEDEPPTPSTSDQRRAGAVELRGFDPTWNVAKSDSFHLTFGVAERHEALDTELSVRVVTPAVLRRAKEGGAFVITHHATIVVTEAHWPMVHDHVRYLVERRCAAPTRAHALALAQRYFSYGWETAHDRVAAAEIQDAEL